MLLLSRGIKREMAGMGIVRFLCWPFILGKCLVFRIEASVAETEIAAQILKDSMIDAGKIYLKDVPIVVDVSVVDNWYQK